MNPGREKRFLEGRYFIHVIRLRAGKCHSIFVMLELFVMSCPGFLPDVVHTYSQLVLLRNFQLPTCVVSWCNSPHSMKVLSCALKKQPAGFFMSNIFLTGLTLQPSTLLFLFFLGFRACGCLWNSSGYSYRPHGSLTGGIPAQRGHNVISCHPTAHVILLMVQKSG